MIHLATDQESPEAAAWRFEETHADAELRTATDGRLLAVIQAGPEQQRILRALKLAASVDAQSATVFIDFKQADEILAMFGGEPGEITLQLGEGHSGRGLYAHYTEYLEEGAEFLGVTDQEAMPIADASEAAEAQSPIELRGVPETLMDQGGAWRSCSGCHELNEGHDTGPYSAVLKCHLGNGCSECGGIGAVWDTTDYAGMAGHVLAATPVQQTDAALLNVLRDRSWDLRCFAAADDAVGWRVVAHYMAAPRERTVAEVCEDDPREAIRAALQAAKGGA